MSISILRSLRFIVFAKMSCARIPFRSLFTTVTAFAVATSHIAHLSAQNVGQQSRAQIVLQLGHSAEVTSVAFSADGSTALSGSKDKTFKLWDLASGREIRTFAGHSDDVTSVALSPDGRTALSTGMDRSLRLWDVASGREIRTFTWPYDFVQSATFSPDGRTALLGTFKATVKLWDVPSWREIRTFKGHSHEVNSVALSPDSRTALSASYDKTIKLWDIASGREISTFKGHTGNVTSVAFSPDGRTALSASYDKTIKLWDVTSGRELRTFKGHSDNVTSVAFSPDGRSALSGSRDRTLRLWDVATGREIRTFEGQSTWISSFSPDGRTALSKSYGMLSLWDVATGREVRTFTGKSDAVCSVALSPDGRTAVAGGADKNVKLWDIATGRLLKTFTGHSELVYSVAFSPDGRTVLSGSLDMTAKLWDVGTGREIRTFAGHSSVVSSVAFAADGRSALSGSGDRTVKLWDVASGREIRTFTGHSESVLSVAFSPDGRTALSGDLLNYFKLWDVAAGREISTFTEHSGIGASGALSPNGGIALSRKWDGTVWLIDVASGREVRTSSGHSDRVASAALSPDGRTALSGSGDNTIKLWDATSGRELKRFTGHSGVVSSVALSPDGGTILSGSWDGTVRLWDVARQSELTTMISFPDGSWLTITPEGFFEASSPQAAQNLSIVRGLEVSSVEQVYNALYRPDLVREKLAGDPNGKVKAAAAQLDLDKVMSSGAAPKVAMTSPAPGSSSTTDEVAVEATIVDQGGGIGKVEWRVNGVTMGLEGRGLERIDAPAAGAPPTGRIETVKRTLSLEPGNNRIEVVAYNAKGLIASEPAHVTVKWDGAKTATPPKLFVLAVGVNDYYDSRLRLAYAVPDATALAEGFRKAGLGLYASVEVKTVLDSEVTLANLDKVFAEMSQKVSPRDVFVFFLAGHGKTKQGRYYFLPRDFRYEDETSIEKAGMGQDKFQAWFASISARKSLLLYDTCESGSLTGANARGSDVDERLGALNRMARATGRTFLTATTDDAPALEGYRGHGVFTYALLDALDHADVNKNGLIEVSELADYIDQKVPDYSFEAFKLRQIPQRSIVGNNFALANKAEVLAATPGWPKTGATSTPANPTHVIVAPTDVKDSISETANTIIHLTPGTQVRLIETTGGWILIARDGQKLGYVRGNAIAGLQ